MFHIKHIDIYLYVLYCSTNMSQLDKKHNGNEIESLSVKTVICIENSAIFRAFNGHEAINV